MEKIEGFTLGERASDGETLCTGCWDKSDNNSHADHEIPAGAPVYWRCASTMYQQWDAYCAACARASAVE